MKRPPATALYYARNEACLRNGSYFRVDGSTFAHYVNGDYLCTLPIIEWPKSAVETYQVFLLTDAKQLIPKCCM